MIFNFSLEQERELKWKIDTLRLQDWETIEDHHCC